MFSLLANNFNLDLKEAIEETPLSLSTPNLYDLSQHNPFQPLRRSASSSELLYEKAMQRFYQAVQLEETQRNPVEDRSHLHANYANDVRAISSALEPVGDTPVTHAPILSNLSDVFRPIPVKMHTNYNSRRPLLAPPTARQPIPVQKHRLRTNTSRVICARRYSNRSASSTIANDSPTTICSKTTTPKALRPAFPSPCPIPPSRWSASCSRCGQHPGTHRSPTRTRTKT